MDWQNGLVLIVATLLVMAIAYRYYSAFIAAKVLALDDARVTPAYRLKDGQNYAPTNKWILFGHHFAAIAGAGPLIGPVLAAQFGYMPGFLWILVGVCLAGAVQDLVILVFSMRRNGKSLAQLAFAEIGKPAGTAAVIGILFVLVIALAGLGKVVTQALGGDTVTYPAGTRFEAHETEDPDAIIIENMVHTPVTYTVYPGTRIFYPQSATPQVVGSKFDLQLVPRNPDAASVSIMLKNTVDEVPVAPGTLMQVPRGQNLQVSGVMGIVNVLVPQGSTITVDEKGTSRITKDLSRYPARYHLTKGATINRAGMSALRVEQDFDLMVQAAGNRIVDLEVLKKRDRSYVVVVPDEKTATVSRQVPGSTWGMFTIALTIPIALLIGYYIFRLRGGKGVLEGSIVGGLLMLGAVWAGGSDWSVFENLRSNLNLTKDEVGYAIAIYGFIASVLPVWILLCPRDYLSSFMKIGTVVLLVVGIIFARPHLHAPAFNMAFMNGGPIIKGQVFPFVFITIMCGAISGFHALVSSGTTPKMIEKEKHARTIGYGAMLIEGLVGIIALIAATSLPSSYYYNINTDWKDLPLWQQEIAKQEVFDKPVAGETQAPPLSAMEQAVGENLQSRTGGAVTLAVGMARIFDTAAHNLGVPVDWNKGMATYWYHFAIMFEALFILTTIDAGTRVGRFLLQETMGKWIHPSLGKTDNWGSAFIATALIVAGWWYFMNAGEMSAIWPMFGIANQMLAVMALAIGTAGLVHMGKGKFAWVTAAPMVFVGLTTSVAAAVMTKKYSDVLAAQVPWTMTKTHAVISLVCIAVIVICTGVVVVSAIISTGRKDPVIPMEGEDEGRAETMVQGAPESGPGA